LFFADTARTRTTAIVAGLIGFVLSVLTPLLPVRQDVASLDWPQPGSAEVSAPLVSYVPLSFSATVPCNAGARLQAGEQTLLSTIPTQSELAPQRGLVVSYSGGAITVLQRNIPLASIPSSVHCAALRIDSTSTRTAVAVLGAPAGFAQPPAVTSDVRPQLVGIFTDLPGGRLDGLHAHAAIDSRFTSVPSWIKVLAMLVALAATALALVALHRLDLLDGRGARRVLRWGRVTAVDAVVLGILLIWHFIGANTSDDGYILTMARVAPHAGYMANYYRWFGVPEAPFGWSYDMLALLARVSTASPWARLMTLIPAIVCWLVISREVLPRLGVAVRNNRVALWTAGLVFLAFWMPYNNGLRPEPLIAMGALLTWASIERAIATGRLLPAAVAVLIAAFSLAAGPTGLICVAGLLAGSRPVLVNIIRRARGLGGGQLGNYLALFAPGLAAGTIVLVPVFAGQALAPVLESIRVRKIIGPNVAWFGENQRYDALLSISPDGSMARRFGVLVLFLALLVCTMQVLRKGGRIPGAAKGPTNRILGIVFASLLLMMFTPTKWTHHFGVYAGLAGALAALAAVAVGAEGIRSRRNRALFAAAVLFVLAFAFTGTNGWWYVSSYGIPWWDKPVSVHGKGGSTVFLGLTVLALLVALWHHYREPFLHRKAREAVTSSNRWSLDVRRARPISRPRTGRFTPAPLTVAAALVVLFELASFAKGAMVQRHSYSIAAQNLRSLTGDTCGLSTRVLVETDPNRAMLTPVTPGSSFAAESTGFTPDGVAADLTADQQDVAVGGANSVSTGADAGKTTATTSAGTASGTQLPFGLAQNTPVMGNYTEGDKKPATFTSTWYRLDRRGPLLVITAAGRIHSIDASGVATYGQDVTVEYGQTKTTQTIHTAAKTGRARSSTVTKVHALGTVVPFDIGPAPSWRNLRVPLSAIPTDADAVRIVVDAPDLTRQQWVAVTPPRVPVLRTLQDVVGTIPVLLDWHVGLAFPCQRPFGHRDGVAEIPRYRILPDRGGADVANHWQDWNGGGPLGWTELLFDAQTVPTYLDDDWHRDWGSLSRFLPYRLTPPARLTIAHLTRSGLATDPPMLIRP
jgi:arabinosyltransferase C